MSREYTNKLLELIQEYNTTELRDLIILSCLNYMSEDEVKDMCRLNDLLNEDEDEQESQEVLK